MLPAIRSSRQPFTPSVEWCRKHEAMLGMLLVLLTLMPGGMASAQWLFQDPVTLDTLDGNYRVIASCAFARLAPNQSGLARSDEQGLVRIMAGTGWIKQWELAFVNEEGGRQTRLDWTAGSYPSEHVLSTARACAA
jgi:hypothetical protein